MASPPRFITTSRRCTTEPSIEMAAAEEEQTRPHWRDTVSHCLKRDRDGHTKLYLPSVGECGNSRRTQAQGGWWSCECRSPRQSGWKTWRKTVGSCSKAAPADSSSWPFVHASVADYCSKQHCLCEFRPQVRLTAPTIMPLHLVRPPCQAPRKLPSPNYDATGGMTRKMH